MEKNTIRASRNNKFEIVLSGNSGVLPPLIEPATQEEQTAYQLAGQAVAKGSFEEAENILRKAGFTILDNE